jgi:hypothetical protein
MSGPYFQKLSWPAFIYQQITYDLSHLDEFIFPIVDSQKTKRTIAVTFGDHCFTRNPLPGDDPNLMYPRCSRNPGCFCFDRYAASKQLATSIEAAKLGMVWMVKGENYAFIPKVNVLGNQSDYAIVFSMKRVKRLQGVDLHMFVESAYFCDRYEIQEYGNVRFPHLATLRMRDEVPGRQIGYRRRLSSR